MTFRFDSDRRLQKLPILPVIYGGLVNREYAAKRRCGENCGEVWRPDYLLVKNTFITASI
jgi:hypothetical protein